MSEIEVRGDWRPLPDAPLSARHSANAFWTGSEVLVLGGTSAEPCPPGQRCPARAEPALADGAMYDPRSRSWTAIEPAPVGINWASGAIVGERLYLWVSRGVSGNPNTAFLAYDIATDRWDGLTPPPTTYDQDLRLVAAGDLVVAVHHWQEIPTLHDLIYDPLTGAWSQLPADPIGPSFDRDMVWTGDELVLLGIAMPEPESNPPDLYRAAAFNPSSGTWRRLPDSEITGGSAEWFFANGLIINPRVGSAVGDPSTNVGQAYPLGGILDPTPGAWSVLPSPPSELGSYRGPPVGGEAFVIAPDAGWALHVPTMRWLRIPNLSGVYGGQAAVWASDRLILWGGAGWDGKEALNLAVGWEWVP
jgi:hypothetical protein